MRNLLAHHRQAGFTLVETLLAIMMISVVGILGSRSILSTTLSVSTLNNQRKAATLSEMIFQQYNSYVAQNYNGLESYNKTNVEPSVFFGSPNNMGFDGIYVTTVADYSTNHSTATIKLTLSWKEGGKTKSSDFLKTYAQKSELGSGVVQVYVKAPCSGYTDPALIMANCPGLSNFTISAPTPSGANLTGTTDATGSLLLRGVNVGASVSITVTAPTPSVYTVAKGAAGFVQGYYMVDPKNPQNYLLTSDFPMSVQLGQTDQLLITTFLPAGSVTGQVTNISSVSPTPITDNERIDLHSGFVATAAGFTSCSKILPCSTTTQGGKYAFYNVVTSTSVSVVPYGTMGSAPLIQPTDPAFHWGTLAAPGFDNVVIVPTDWSSTTPPTVTRDISLQVLGWFNLTTVSVSNPALVVPNFPINFNDQALNPIYTNNVHSDSPTDANGHISLYNVVYYTGNLGFFQFYGVQQPFGSNAGAMVQQFGASSAAIGAGTSLQLPVYPGYTLRGSITDSNSTNNCAKKLTMWGPNFFNTAQPNVTTDNAGNFTYLGFYPANYWGSIGTVDPTNFIAYINVQNTTPAGLTTVRVAATTWDNVMSMPAPHSGVWISEGANPQLGEISDGNGALNLPNIKIPYYDELQRQAVCDPLTLVCSICDTSTLCTSLLPQNFHIDSTSSKMMLNWTQYGNVPGAPPGYLYNFYPSVPVNAGIASGNINVTLQLRNVDGTVRNSQGGGVSGIQIYDTNNNLLGTTDASGHFGPWVLYVENRTGPSSPGNITLQIPAQNSYNAFMAQPLLPMAVDPSTTMTVTITLTGGTSSAGGL